ncbi:hypothetical protein [Alkalicoccus saliphilus]|nr:hypothetical protein [Alkalicoccus saliphilus]
MEEINGLQVAFDRVAHEQSGNLELAFQQTDDGGGLVMNNGSSDCC